MAHLASIKSFLLVFFLVTGLCLPPVALSADSSDQIDDSSKELSVKGHIRSVSVSDQTFILKKVKGKMRLTLDPQTVFEGFSKLKDLKPEDLVRVWYRLDATRNIAVKIAKLPDLGC